MDSACRPAHKVSGPGVNNRSWWSEFANQVAADYSALPKARKLLQVRVTRLLVREDRKAKRPIKDSESPDCLLCFSSDDHLHHFLDEGE